MTRAEIKAHWALPDETLGDGYTLTHKREREAFVKGYHKAIEDACEWLKSYRQDTPDGTGYIAGIVNDKTIEDFRSAMEE